MSPTNFPAALDTTTELPNNRTNTTFAADNHVSDHNNTADAIIAIETELGINPSQRLIAASSQYARGVLGTTGLLGYWRLSDPSGTARDISGNNRHGTYSATGV